MGIGSPEALIAGATARAADEWSFLREVIAQAAAGASSVEDAQARVAAALKALVGDKRITEPLAQTGTLANLAGQMHVRLVEMHGRYHLLSRRHLDDGQPQSFLSMTFEEALAYWTAKGGDPELLKRVLGAYRRQAAVAGQMALDTISQRAIDAITRTIEEGGTMDDFVRAVREDDADLVNLGISPASDSYLDLVFRTQVAGAYGAGRYAQLSSPDVIAARPYRQGRTSEDERVRPEHRPIDGVIWRADDPTFADVASPFGFRCRCVVVSLDEDEFRAEGGVVASSLPAGFVITPGFGASAF